MGESMGKLLKFPGKPDPKPVERKKKRAAKAAAPDKKPAVQPHPPAVDRVVDDIDKAAEDPLAGRNRILAVLKQGRRMPMDSFAGLFEDARKAIDEAGKFTMDDADYSRDVMGRLREIVAKADRYKFMAVSRHLDHDLTLEQLEIELARASVVSYLAAAAERINDAAFSQTKPGAYVLTAVIGERLADLVEGGLLPESKSYVFSYEERREAEELARVYDTFANRLRPLAKELGIPFNEFKEIVESAKALMNSAITMFPAKPRS